MRTKFSTFNSERHKYVGLGGVEKGAPFGEKRSLETNLQVQF